MFKILKKSKSSRARLGVIETPHGEIHTPAFVPVATQATIKGITVDQLKTLGIESILSNTYHLYLRPGDKVVKKMGGLHKFMNWDRPVWTDSGGFQAFSLGAGLEHQIGKLGWFPGMGRSTDLSDGTSRLLAPVARGGLDSRRAAARRRNDNERAEPARLRDIPHDKPADLHHHEKLVRITEDGVEFRSHLDGSKHFFTPEKSMEIQRNLGADIIFAFDECTSPLHDYAYIKKSLERTHKWAVRCLNAKRSTLKAQSLFSIVQGGEFKDLREKSAKFIGEMDFDGFGIGGSLGKTKEDMFKVLKWTMSLLPTNKPRHLLGIGSPEDIYKAVKHGIDTFDCVLPTRLGRIGIAYLWNGLAKQATLNIKSSRYLTDKNPIDKKCSCAVCQEYSRAYISHLFRANEMLGPILVTLHNLAYMENLMRTIRKAI